MAVGCKVSGDSRIEFRVAGAFIKAQTCGFQDDQADDSTADMVEVHVEFGKHFALSVVCWYD